MSTTLPQTIAAQVDVLPLDGLTLIGLFTGPEGGRALLRAPSGDIQKLNPGEHAFGVTLTAVDDMQAVVTDANGNAFVLEVPGV